MKTVPSVRLVDTPDAAALPDLPGEIALAMADVAGAAREGLMAMSVAAGMAVMAAMFEAEIAEVFGPKGMHNRGGDAVRHGTGKGSVDVPQNRGGMHNEESHARNAQEVRCGVQGGCGPHRPGDR